MKKLFLFAIICILLAGCAPNVTVKGDMKLSQNTPFAISYIENQCGINPEGKDSVQLMKDAIDKAIAESQLPQGKDGYAIDVIITEYQPGDAFKRWLMPGWGETKLTVQCIVKEINGDKAGEMEVSKSIADGGAYTIGAWNYVFSDVAKAMVEEIKKRIV